MNSEITTDGLQTKFIDILKTYYQFIRDLDFGKNTVLKIILMKILTNLQSANLLWSNGMCQDAFIIIRSAFNSFILFEYLSSFPNEIETYKTDSELSEFKNLYEYYKMRFLSIEELNICYQDLGDKTKERLKNVIDYRSNILKLDKLENFFKNTNNYKSITQKMHKMKEELRKIDKPHFDAIELNYFSSWNINSQITHGELHQLKGNFVKLNYTDKQNKLFKEIKECFRQSVGIIAYSMESIDSLIKPEDHFKKDVWDKIIIFYDYLGYDINKLFKIQKNIQSDLIEIIKTPIFIPYLQTK